MATRRSLLRSTAASRKALYLVSALTYVIFISTKASQQVSVGSAAVLLSEHQQKEQHDNENADAPSRMVQHENVIGMQTPPKNRISETSKSPHLRSGTNAAAAGPRERPVASINVAPDPRRIRANNTTLAPSNEDQSPLPPANSTSPIRTANLSTLTTLQEPLEPEHKNTTVLAVATDNNETMHLDDERRIDSASNQTSTTRAMNSSLSILEEPMVKHATLSSVPGNATMPNNATVVLPGKATSNHSTAIVPRNDTIRQTPAPTNRTVAATSSSNNNKAETLTEAHGELVNSTSNDATTTTARAARNESSLVLEAPSQTNSLLNATIIITEHTTIKAFTNVTTHVNPLPVGFVPNHSANTNHTPPSTSTTTTTTASAKTWSNLKVAVYMTTHLSEEHLNFIKLCWPAAVQNLPLLRDAHLIVYTSTDPPAALQLDQLGFQSVTVRRHTEPPPLARNASYTLKDRRKQAGAIKAMLDPFEKENQWFKDYDWVMRLNPDVLIRRDSWLRETMLNTTVDGIFIDYSSPDGKHKALHSDFYAFRPSAVNVTALFRKQRRPHAEAHVYRGFEHVIAQHRAAWLPHAERRKRLARVVGRKSDVIHWHPLVNQCPDYFNATDGRVF